MGAVSYLLLHARLKRCFTLTMYNQACTYNHASSGTHPAEPKAELCAGTPFDAKWENWDIETLWSHDSAAHYAKVLLDVCAEIRTTIDLRVRNGISVLDQNGRVHGCNSGFTRVHNNM